TEGGSPSLSSILGRLLGEDTIAQIGSGAIASPEALRERLDDLDQTDGNVTFARSGDGFVFDMTVATTLDGVTALDLEAFGGTLFLQGNIHLSVDIGLHLIFGVDSQGFFFQPTAPGDHTLTLSHIQIDSD